MSIALQHSVRRRNQPARERVKVCLFNRDALTRTNGALRGSGSDISVAKHNANAIVISGNFVHKYLVS
jgi:hypothetical protein